MSKNCINCVENERTGSDMLCDRCREATSGVSPSLKSIRESYGMTQKKISEELCIGKKTWVRWENQEEQPSDSMLKLIALWEYRSKAQKEMERLRRLWSEQDNKRLKAEQDIVQKSNLLVEAKSALENWGRHFDWCEGKSQTKCTCGLSNIIQRLSI